jgi:primosomal protein N'
MHQYLKQRVLSEKIGLLLYSPMPAPIDRINNKYRWRMIIKCIYNEQINSLLRNALNENEAKKGVWQTIEINPSNMM